MTFKANGSEAKVSGKEIVLIDLGNRVYGPPAKEKYVEVELTDWSEFAVFANSPASRSAKDCACTRIVQHWSRMAIRHRCVG